MWIWIGGTFAACDERAADQAFAKAENAYMTNDPRVLKAAVRDVERATRCDPIPDHAVHRLLIARSLLAASDNEWTEVHDNLRGALAANPLLPVGEIAVKDARLRTAFFRAQEEPIQWSVHPRTGVWTPDAPTGTPSHRGRVALRTTGLALATGAAVTYGAAWVSRGEYERVRGGPSDEVLPPYRTTNALSVSSLTLASLSAISLGVSFAL